MTQWVKACITEHDSLSSVPRTYKVEERQPLQAFL